MGSTAPGKTVTLAKDAPATVTGILALAAARHGQRPLIVFDDGSSISYADAFSLAGRVACGLRAMGVEKGGRVVSVSSACPEAALVFWGTMLAGGVFVTMDASSAPERLKSIIDGSGTRAVFTDPGLAASGAMAGLDPISYGPTALPSAMTFDGWLQTAPDAPGDANACPGDDAAIIFTSGTTGAPRGVVLSHGALAGSGRLMADAYGWGREDRLLSAGDFHTISGLRNPLIAAPFAGASFISAPHSARSSAPACSLIMERLGATILCTVPAMLAQFNIFHEKVAAGFTERLRFVMCAGSPLPASVAASFERLYKRPVLNYYGLTETAGLCVGVLPGMETRCKGTIGVPVGARVRIALEDGAEAARGEAGELLVISENLMTRYHDDAPSTEQAFRDGWYRTRDMCRQRPDGSIELLGRRDDAFKDLRGELVHPYEIEREIEKIPFVLEAAVCGHVGEDGRPGAAAFVVARERDADEALLSAELRKRLLASLGPYSTPTLIRFVASLPRSANGKLLRRQLMEGLR